ncbi:MAG: DUF4351 domain-containing protein [Cyanobacteriota bacterium]|nr:DUF4351 domain-containing protein [Cyanobacteriota bacterium]
MTRFRHDRFAKSFLADLLEPLGQVEVSREVTDEAREIDLYFTPAPGQDPQSLGLLGRMVLSPCLLEPFRNPVDRDGIRSCIAKQFVIYSELQRQTKSGDSPPQIPFLWILTPTASPEILTDCGGSLNLDTWMEGIYFLPTLLRTALVVIHLLPRRSDTLWLRLLGRNRFQQQAIQELSDLPSGDPVGQNVLRRLYNLKIALSTEPDLLEEEREFLMNLSPAYLKWEEETIGKAKLEGKEEEALSLISRLVVRRFGKLTPAAQTQLQTLTVDQLEELGLALFDFSSQSDLITWLQKFSHE